MGSLSLSPLNVSIKPSNPIVKSFHFYPCRHIQYSINLLLRLPAILHSARQSTTKMAPFRNPFGKKTGFPNGGAPEGVENQRPSLGDQGSQASSRTSSSINIKAKKEEPSEYKLSGMQSKKLSIEALLVI